MLQKVITGENSNTGTSSSPISLKMQYNKGNQLISMANGQDRIAYSYDKNGSMVKKVLTSKAYGKLSDTYEYNTLDQLTSYIGYDGYQQQLTYNANGIRLSKREAGNTNRSTPEELLRGNIARLPEIVEPNKNDTLPKEPEWASIEYLYDLTQEYYQVIEEKNTSKNATSKTAYAYGIERIAAYTDTQKTTYVYDGRGSVVQTLTIPVAGQSTMAALPDTQVKVQSFSYTAFGEQMSRKVSGFGYNAEAFDAAYGMINLRARQYEPGMNRFGQKDLHAPFTSKPLSLNEYLFAYNNPIKYVDIDGLVPSESNKRQINFGKKKSEVVEPQFKMKKLAEIETNIDILLKNNNKRKSKKDVKKVIEALEHLSTYMDARTLKVFEGLKARYKKLKETKLNTSNDWINSRAYLKNHTQTYQFYSSLCNKTFLLFVVYGRISIREEDADNHFICFML